MVIVLIVPILDTFVTNIVLITRRSVAIPVLPCLGWALVPGMGSAVVDQSQRTIFRGMGIFNNIYLDRWYIGSDESDKDVRIAS